MFNMVVTNVPGSPVPLYLDGARMRGFTGMAGVYDGMSLTLVVLSYCDALSISITSTPDALREPQALITYMEESLDELESAVQQTGMAQGIGMGAALPVMQAGR